MPFKSKKQMRALFAKAPRLARQWVDRYGVPANEESPKSEPSKKKSKKTKKSSS